MSNDVDLQYDPQSFAGELDRKELEAFEAWLRRTGHERISFDPAYVEHLSRFHGGVPKRRCFRTVNGTEKVVVRFLNFAESDHALAQYSVESTWSMISDRMGLYLMPFAELFAGDLLCFDHREAGCPRVVVWLHELSQSGRPPETEFVANSFDEFLEMLYE